MEWLAALRPWTSRTMPLWVSATRSNGSPVLRSVEMAFSSAVAELAVRLGDWIGEPAADLATVDVSFISLTLVLPAVLRSLRPGADVLALVKPQFEAGRREVARGGVVRDHRVHATCVARVAGWALDHGLRVRGTIRSPLLGPAGNREFFLWLRLPGAEDGARPAMSGRRP